MSAHAHLDLPRAEPDHPAMDDMGAFAESHPITRRAHRALPLASDWPTNRKWVAPQGRIEQGWPARRCSSEPETLIVDRLPEDFDQGDSADAEVVAWLLKAFGVVVLALFSAWCIANYLALANV